MVLFEIDETNKNFKAKMSGYGANSVDELTKVGSQELIDKFEAAYKAKKEKEDGLNNG